MLINWALHLLPNIFPRGISVWWPPGLRTDWAFVVHRFTHRSGLTDRTQPIQFSACTADPANVELVSQHSPSSSTWGSSGSCGTLLRFLLASRLARAPRPVWFRVPRSFRSACLLVRPFSAPLLLRCWRLFYHPFLRKAFSWFGVSESNIRTESASADRFLLSSKLAVSTRL